MMSSAKESPTIANFVSYILPPIICYFAIAFLVLLPRTQPIRIVLCPLTVILAFRAETSLDMSWGKADLQLLSVGLRSSMFCIAIRALEWAVQTNPLIRHSQPADQRQRSPSDIPMRKVVLDCLDLVSTLRGCGWDWSQGLYVAPEKRFASSRLAFATSTLVSALKHALLYGVGHFTMWSFSPDTFGSANGGTIFDDSLPPHLRYLRSSIITILCTLTSYFFMLFAYELVAALCIVLFRQYPDQWPPIFDSPWRASSLREFWSQRWHQLFRQVYTFLGRPLSLLLGRPGRIIGAFLVSGFFHHIQLQILEPSSEMWRQLLPFGMMGVGMVLENAVAGKNVGGWRGRLWMMSWLLLWGNMIVDAWARVGVFGILPSFLDDTRLGKGIEWVVNTFDEYLRGI